MADEQRLIFIRKHNDSALSKNKVERPHFLGTRQVLQADKIFLRRTKAFIITHKGTPSSTVQRSVCFLSAD